MRTMMMLAVLLAGCASSPAPVAKVDDQVLILDKQLHPMTRNEVITAINECEANRTRAVVINSRRRVNGVTVEVPVGVTCAPRYWDVGNLLRN